MVGEFLYFGLYVLQQLGVMLGVGAQTVLLCTHLIAVHRGEIENGRASYARATRAAVGLGLFLMIASGAGAVVLHVLNNELTTVLTPAFLFKWALIFALLVAFLSTRPVVSSNVLYALTGGTWYALFLVHSLGPVTTWLMLLELYVAWMVLFAFGWALFVGLMHWQRKAPVPALSVPIVKKEIPKATPPPPPPQKVVIVQKPVVPPPPPPPPPPKPVPPPAPVVPPPPPPVPKPIAIKEVPKVSPMPAPAPRPPAPVAPSASKVSWWARLMHLFARKPKAVRPAIPPPLTSAPTAPVKKPLEPTHVPLTITKAPMPTMAPVPPAAPILPVVHPLSLEAHAAPAVPPVPAVVTAPPPEPPAEKSFIEEVIDHLHVPALRIMPQRVEDIGKQNRPPVVKLGDSE